MSTYSSEISGEVMFYLESRGYDLSELKTPLFRTVEPFDEEGAVFDIDEVDAKILALSKLKHTKGKWAGKPIIPTTNQVAHIIAPIFGWRRWDEDSGRYLRIITEAYIEMTRKSAKTTLVASLAMVLAFADNEPGAEVVFGAASKDQARMAFRPLKSVVDFSPDMKAAGIRSVGDQIRQEASDSTIWVASSRGDLTHGANLHGGLIDELHVHRDDSLLEAVESGTGARDQPLVFIITTADDGSVTSVYAQRREMIEKLAKGILHNPASFGVVFAAARDADPFDEETWRQANLLYPVTPTRRYMKAAAEKARSSPRALSSFKRLHLGIRDRAGTAFFDLHQWDLAGGGKPRRESDFRDAVAFGGLDLASVRDITALVWLFQTEDPLTDGYDVLCRFWAPEGAIDRLDESTVGTASRWVEEGWITATPGDVTDYSFIEKKIQEDYSKFDVQAIGFDPWNATHLVNNLRERDMEMEKVLQGYRSLSAPLKEIERLVLQSKKNKPMLRHGGNPVLRWMADNMRPAMDASGNLKPDKGKSKDKIDGISALTTAMFVAHHTDIRESVYESRGVEVI